MARLYTSVGKPKSTVMGEEFAPRTPRGQERQELLEQTAIVVGKLRVFAFRLFAFLFLRFFFSALFGIWILRVEFIQQHSWLLKRRRYHPLHFYGVEETMLIHVVYFWLNDDVPANEAVKLAESCRSLLGKIPVVRQLWAGGPADTPRRDIIDASYAVGLIVVLDDTGKSHDVYQEHPLHKQFIEQHKAHWKKVQIFDSGDK